MDIQQVATGSLKPNDYNFNQMTDDQLKGLSLDVKKRGYIMHHIVARRVGDELIIIDGEHQWRAAVEAGLETVPVQVVESTGAEAIADTYRRNGLRGETNRLKLARAIRRMQDEGRDETGKLMPNTKAAKVLGRTEGWVRTTLMYAEVADLLAGKAGAPTENDIAGMTEGDVRDMLTTLRNPEAHNATLFGDDAQGQQPKGHEQGQGDAEGEPEATKATRVDRILKQVAKLDPAERSEVSKVLAKMVKEDAKAAAKEKTASEVVQLPS